jgi:bifunctional UDP-N-acetylglucosamine pyrophosphorylase/glucosamine-1-phosphate N-acetyltransferase
VKRLLIIPAAGKGTRLQSAVPKILYPVDGRPVLDHLLDLYEPVVDHILLVLHPSFAAAVEDHCGRRARRPEIVLQDPPSGMLPAILLPSPLVARYAPASVWVTWGDQVGIHPRTVARLAEISERVPVPALSFPTVWQAKPYIHFVRDARGDIVDVLQRREGSDMPPRGESDSGLFCFSQEAYVDLLPEFAAHARPGSQTGEVNFLPFIPWIATRRTVHTFPLEEEMESIGINTIDDVRAIERYLRARR